VPSLRDDEDYELVGGGATERAPDPAERHLEKLTPEARELAERMLARQRPKMAARSARRQALADAYAATEIADVRKLNRQLAIKSVTLPDGTVRYFGACACSFHGPQQTDRAIAIREYEAHECSIDGDSIHRTFAGSADKRPKSALIPALRGEREAEGTRMPGEDLAEVEPVKEQVDDGVARFQLLELKPK
jgi:hypothetical protein